MRVLIIEPYYGGSHKAWTDGYHRNSRHTVDLLTLPAQFWKWRMQGGAITLARQFETLSQKPDVILASGMFNVASFMALTREHLGSTPVGVYFHETQLTYPQNSRQDHGWRYAFINYVSAMAADQVYFNSQYHLDTFFDNLPRMLKHFGDYNELETIESLKRKSSVLPLGLDLKRYDVFSTSHSADRTPLILWNHRWEEDKNPTLFFQSLYNLADLGVDFQVAIVGEQTRHNTPEFDQARERLGQRVVQFGYVESFEAYARLLWEADYVVSSAYQDFFGGAVAEAIYCNCTPILPERLNYPNLIPPEYRKICLYPGDALATRLKRHLRGDFDVHTAPLRAHIEQFDWSSLVKRYDIVLEQLLTLQ